MLKDLLLGVITQKELLNVYNANVSYFDLHDDINGFVFYYKDIYNIIINTNLDYFGKKNTLLHELAHIELNQLCQVDKDLFVFHIDKYEDEAEKYIKFIKESINND